MEYDVAIVGGGTAGTMATLAVVEGGRLRILLIEASSYVRGLSAIGVAWGGFFNNNYKQVIGGILSELMKKCKGIAGRDYFQYHEDGDKWITGLASVDPETARCVIEKESYDAGCDVMLFSILDDVKMENGKIRHIEVVSKLGEQQASTDYFIDATGELILASMTDVKWKHGSDEGITQSTSNTFQVLGVGMGRYEAFLDRYINTDNQDPWKKETSTIRRGIEYWCPWKPDGLEDTPKSLKAYYRGKNDDVILSCTNTYINPLDIMEISKVSYQLKEEAFHVVDYLRYDVAGFESAYITTVYDLAARETRRICGSYILTMEDIASHKHFEGAIGMETYPPGVHSPTGTVHTPSTRESDSGSDGTCNIPLRYLTSSITNLTAARKCISATSEAQSTTRGIGLRMVKGQGAGTAIAPAAESGIEDIHSLGIKKLQQILKKQSVIFDG